MRVASRVMHAAIGKLVCLRLKIDKNRFMVGNMAPDAPLGVKNGKDISHFALGVNRDERTGRYIDYEKFLEKYRLKLSDSFVLGYYCHLISDELWHIDMYKKYINSHIEGLSKDLLEDYYNDFRLLNTKLISYYEINNDIEVIKDIAIDEINLDALDGVIKQFNDDFSMPSNSYNEHLRLINFQDVVNYIDKSAKLAVSKIEDIIKI